MNHRVQPLGACGACIATVLALAVTAARPAEPVTTTSPDGRLRVVVELRDGTPRSRAALDGETALDWGTLGLTLEDADLSTDLHQAGVTDPRIHEDRYEILTAKRRLNRYTATERTFRYKNAEGRRLDLTLRVSDDGFAFRYTVPARPDAPDREIAVEAEATTYRFPPDASARIQPMAEAKTGWESTNPSYEEHYHHGVLPGAASPIGAGWVYPALVRTGAGDDAPWALITEAGLDRTHCGTRLVPADEPDAFRVGFPDPREVVPGGALKPGATGSWSSPWRVVVVGDLETITESMLGVHLARPAEFPVEDWIKPGHASWSWVLLKDERTIEPVQRRFIDYAADMNWDYCLVDCDWDRRIGYTRLAALAEYGREKGVGVIAWYNSAGSWNTTPYTPRGKLLTHNDREAEFARLHEMGIAGVKVDFFGGDGRSMINHYIDILESAARHHLLVNFHGATLPRGWHRTYPHLMTAEAVRGMEFVTFDQADADRVARHAAMLPFTRNAFDPMDFTPMALAGIPGIERRTTAAFELATAVLFTSGIQHFAETPYGMRGVPEPVRALLRDLPAVWDETEFLAGEPGEFVALARRGGGRWYACGINAGDSPRTIELDLTDLVRSEGGTVERGARFTDGGGGLVPIRRETIELGSSRSMAVTLPPRGGFVIRFDG